MRIPKYLPAMLCMVVVACLQVSVSGQTTEEKNKLANVISTGSGVRWDVSASHSGGTLIVSAPDGRVFRKEFKAGASPDFALTDNSGERLPDGTYTYELRLAPASTIGLKEATKLRGRDDEPESERAARKRLWMNPVAESGNFAILNGSAIVAGAVEGESQQPVKQTTLQRAPARFPSNLLTRLRNHRMAMPDFVIADDLIVQGSACVGLDCVNGEVFGFDTIRMKENNTRLQYDDTSTSAGFATNNWQIRANGSGSGGGSFLAFVDQGATGNSESGTIVFEVDAGAPANSLRVSSGGNVGIGTATPVLDVHANTSDTPAIRLEQNNSGGFTAQTWDIGANEANFFVRDVTSGSRLPFRIRPGAPTSSLDISATGNVGIATSSPSANLDVSGNVILVGSENSLTTRTNNTTKLSRVSMPPFTTTNLNFSLFAGATTNTANIVAVGGEAAGMAAATQVDFVTAANTNTDSGTVRMTINSSGQVGIATTSPTQTLSVNGTAGKPGGGSWDIFSDERLKNIKGRFTLGLKAVMQLQPLRYEYKSDNALGIKLPGEQIGFGAQQLQKVIPEAVSRNSAGFLMVNNDPIMWTMLNAIQEQQKQIAELKAEVRKLQKASHRRRR